VEPFNVAVDVCPPPLAVTFSDPAGPRSSVRSTDGNVVPLRGIEVARSTISPGFTVADRT
jgi:hypothetical protein